MIPEALISKFQAHNNFLPCLLFGRRCDVCSWGGANVVRCGALFRGASI